MAFNRERIIELVRQMRQSTVANGCTPGEAAKFAAKVAEWVEKYQIEEAELRSKETGGGFTEDDVEVCQNILSTGKKVFNPGMTQLVNYLAKGMCCECILIHRHDGAVYGIVGDQADADYVCQVASTLVLALRVMAAMEGAEHGHEKARLVQWTNQYLTGAGAEIYRRLTDERRSRAAQREAEHRTSSTALVLVTGEAIAEIKRKVVAEAFAAEYPVTRQTVSRMKYDHEADQRGRAAGKSVSLNLNLAK